MYMKHINRSKIIKIILRKHFGIKYNYELHYFILHKNYNNSYLNKLIDIYKKNIQEKY